MNKLIKTHSNVSILRIVVFQILVQGVFVSASSVAFAENVSKEDVLVKFFNNQPGISFYLYPENDERKLFLCLGECQLYIKSGTYTFALGEAGSEPIKGTKPVRIHKPLLIEGAYRSRSETRTAGWLVLGIGGAISLATAISGFLVLALVDDLYGDAASPFIATGTGGTIGVVMSSIIGVFLVSQGDSVRLSYSPFTRKDE